MNVDEHIAEAKRLLEAASNLHRDKKYRVDDSILSNAHSALAATLLARYPGWEYTGCTPGEYDGTDL